MNTRGRGERDWAEALLNACQDADLTIKVPPNLPVHIALLYDTLGVGVEIDESLPPWQEVKAGWPRRLA